MDPNTRQSKRTPVTLKIKFKSETLAQFIERYAVDVSQGGIFIRTKEPLSAGTPMRFEFQLKDASPLIAGEGTVVWTRENDPTRPGVAPGMGVRFDRLADGSQEVLDRILAEKAKQTPAARQAADTRPPQNAFQEVPTRVAPSPLVNALAGESSQRSGSFGDTRADTTPLPNPMPFHSDADEFPDEAFEEATKVRPLDDLVLQSASMEREPHPPEIAEALDELAARRAARTSNIPPLTGTPLPPGAPPQLALREAPTVSDGPRPTHLSSPPPMAERGEIKPRLLDTSPSPRTAAPRPHDKISEKVPVAAIAEPLPPPPVAGKASRAPVVIVLVLIAMAAGAAAVWFLVLKDKGAEKAGTGTPVASNHPGSGTALGSGSATVGSGSGSSVAVGPGTGAGTGAGTGTVTPSGDLVDVMINAGTDGAIVELVGTSMKGPAPFAVKVAKGKTAMVRISAPGFTAKDLQVTGGDKPVTVNLVAMARMLHVTSTPSGAQIFINGGGTGKQTPADIKLTPAQAARGKLVVTLRKSGYAKAEQIVQASAFAEADDVLRASVDATMTVARSTGGGNRDGSGGRDGGSGATPGTNAGSGSTSTGSGTTSGSGTGPGTGSTSGSDGGTTSGSGGGSGKTSTGSGTTTGSGAGSAKPPGTGSGSTEPTPDWMK